ncbi:transcriptional regulator, TetR family [Tessaracoccus bendigoensis DSM 12906]|uniref:Transcriptional regulator, TetR family n=1 Tax=Tessaracoccus bendigoensis DSM 12906 TaxID=1123357 RepID=A0A1M6F5Z8_9ACTN|nr:TetR/AcrR family transcriptional regulator [Tessaracoccus bendigoensis]SHI93093.1 transcriptional regulator, TetR family [Tessaracoccus bendigoensis DSM 12906]
MKLSDDVVDGRAARWEQHNAERRNTLVDDAVRAIRKLGPGVGMDEIAAQAKTSKTVLYRHFGDKAGLYRAVVASVHDYILRKLPLDDAERLGPRELVAELADAYLAVVERDRNLYLFVSSRPTGDTPTEDPVLSITTRIGNEVAEAFRAWLRGEGLDEEPANIWAHGAVGFIWAVADRWIVTNLRRPRAEVVAYIDQFFAPAFEAQHRS